MITTPATDADHFPDAALDALNNGVLDVPIFHHQPRFCGKRLTRRMGSLAGGLQKCRRNDREKSRLNSGSSTSKDDLHGPRCTLPVRGVVPALRLARSKRAYVIVSVAVM
jgi:hypothetical protein